MLKNMDVPWSCGFSLWDFWECAALAEGTPPWKAQDHGDAPRGTHRIPLMGFGGGFPPLDLVFQGQRSGMRRGRSPRQVGARSWFRVVLWLLGPFSIPHFSDTPDLADPR